jgi:hypothetical protein
MPTTDTTTDPMELARQAEKSGIQHLRQLREELARLTAEQEAQRLALADQLEAATKRFAEAENEARRQQAITEARTAFTAAQDAYQPLADTADQLVSDLSQSIAQVIKLYGGAVFAERARDKAGKRLTTAHQALTRHDPDAPAPRITNLRLHNQPPTSPLGLLGIATALTDDRFVAERADAKRLVEPKTAPMPNITFTTKN